MGVSGCFACFPRLWKTKAAPEPTASPTRRLSIRPFGSPVTTDYSACVQELESLLSASERRSVRIVFSYLCQLETMDGASNTPLSVPGIHEPWSLDKMLRGDMSIEKETLRKYLEVPETIFNHLFACFVDHVNHFHTSGVSKRTTLSTQCVNYHSFLHTVVSLGLLDPTDQRSLFPILDLFAHSDHTYLEDPASPEPDSAETAGKEQHTEEDNAKEVDESFGMTTLSLAEHQKDREHVYRVLAERKKLPKQISRRKSSIAVVMLNDKLVVDGPEDEKLFLTHGDLVKILEALAWFATSKFLLVDSLWGKKPSERGGRLGERRVSYTTWKANKGGYEGSEDVTETPKITVPDASGHIQRSTIIRAADQVFRYAGKAGLVINEKGDFAPHEQITVTELKIWLSNQGARVFGPLVSFAKDRFLTLQFLPFALVRDLEEKDKEAASSKLGEVDPADFVAPAIDLSTELTIPATICQIRGKILRPHYSWLLNNVIPERVARSAAKTSSKPVQAIWSLLYSGSEIGFSAQMFEKVIGQYYGPTMMLISGKAIPRQTIGTPFVEHITLGAYMPKPWTTSGLPFGSEESKIFELEPFYEVFPSTMQALDFARYSPQHGVALGGHGEDTTRIFLDRDFEFGKYQQRPLRQNMSTYAFSRTRGGNQIRDFSINFEILDIEIWGLEGKDAVQLAEEANPMAMARKLAEQKAKTKEDDEALTSLTESDEVLDAPIDMELMKQLDAMPPRTPTTANTLLETK